jgi:hypothetical protein
MSGIRRPAGTAVAPRTAAMKQILFALVVVVVAVAVATPAFAQTEGRISAGASVTFNATTDDEVDNSIGVGFLVRLNPKEGWGPAGAFNWYRAPLRTQSAPDADFANLRIRPLMGGIAYTIANGALLTSFSVVAGPSFNGARFDDDFVRPGGASIDADNSFAFRPGVGVTYTLRPRVALIGFGGYMINRPGVVYRDGAGNETRGRWQGDSVVLSVGAVYSLF